MRDWFLVLVQGSAISALLGLMVVAASMLLH